jgi:hypothetical protein
MPTRRIIAFVIGFAMFCTVARGEPDAFIRAVGFALTGSDDAEPKAIGSRANCVFRIKNDVYRLNNVHIDRISIQGWQRQQPWGLEQWVTVDLHGDEVVFEEDVAPMKDDGSDAIGELRKLNPTIFKAQHFSSKEQQLHLSTSDLDRVKRAWQYIYSRGCVGKPSPF